MKKWVEFDLKIINRVSIFQDFHKIFTINRVRVSRFGPAAPPYPNLGRVPLGFKATCKSSLLLSYICPCILITVYFNKTVQHIWQSLLSSGPVSHCIKLTCQARFIFVIRITRKRPLFACHPHLHILLNYLSVSPVIHLNQVLSNHVCWSLNIQNILKACTSGPRRGWARAKGPEISRNTSNKHQTTVCILYIGEMQQNVCLEKCKQKSQSMHIYINCFYSF